MLKEWSMRITRWTSKPQTKRWKDYTLCLLTLICCNTPSKVRRRLTTQHPQTHPQFLSHSRLFSMKLIPLWTPTYGTVTSAQFHSSAPTNSYKVMHAIFHAPSFTLHNSLGKGTSPNVMATCYLNSALLETPPSTLFRPFTKLDGTNSTPWTTPLSATKSKDISVINHQLTQKKQKTWWKKSLLTFPCT